MDFRILGPLEVLDEGRVLPVAGRSQRTLLALLLVHANQTLGTDRLIDDLWGEHPPAGAAKTILVRISRLRAALGRGHETRGALVTRERGYASRSILSIWTRVASSGSSPRAAATWTRAASSRLPTRWRARSRSGAARL